MDLTEMETQMVAQLKSNVEYKDEYANGDVWGGVYLDNLDFSGLTRSGLLGSLKKKGLYKDAGQGFGRVLM